MNYDVIGVTEIMCDLGIPWRDLEAMVAAGKFPASIDGRNMTWDRAAVEAWKLAKR